jgi:hypothetical protein
MRVEAEKSTVFIRRISLSHNTFSLVSNKKNEEDARAENRRLCLSDFTPRELMLELKRRGYEGRLTYVETHMID